MSSQEVVYGGRVWAVIDVPDVAAAVSRNAVDREWHRHPSDICECGPYRWPCPECGESVIGDGEGLAEQVSMVGDGRCTSCFVGEPRSMSEKICPECGGPVELRVSPRFEREYVCLGTCKTVWPKLDFELATAEVQR